TLAERWAWTAASVTTDKGETLTLTVTGDVITNLVCSCLLNPKCLHVAAVVTLLEPAGEVSAPTKLASPITAAATVEPIGADAVTAARRAFRALSDVLGGGAESAGAFAQAELLRAIHACRSTGLHRLASGQTRILRSIRELRADKPEF